MGFALIKTVSEDHLLIAEDDILVEHYRRVNTGEWGVSALETGDILELSCLPLKIPLGTLYDGIASTTPESG